MIVMYFPQCVHLFENCIKMYYGTHSFDAFILINIAIIGGIPIFIFFYMRNGVSGYTIEDPDFKRKFIVLYKNVETYRKTEMGKLVPQLHMTSFCFFRILLSFTTLFLPEHMFLNMLTYWFVSIGTGYYYVHF